MAAQGTVVTSAQTLSTSQQETRAKILDAAAELFYQHGVNAVGVNEIAATARASKLSMYRYFPSKGELVAAMLTEHSDRIHAWLRRKTEDSPAGPDRVLSVFDLLMTWFAQPGYGGCTVVNTTTDTRNAPEIAAIARRHLSRYRSLLEERLREAGADRPRETARYLLLLIEGASVICSIEGNTAAGADARQVAQRLLQTSIPSTSGVPVGSARTR